jgi:8-oxo-dGTP diphosphatase
MTPEWRGIKAIPYSCMWPDSKYWLPVLLRGREFEGKFIFEKRKLIAYDLEVG